MTQLASTTRPQTELERSSFVDIVIQLIDSDVYRSKLFGVNQLSTPIMAAQTSSGPECHEERIRGALEDFKACITYKDDRVMLLLGQRRSC